MNYDNDRDDHDQSNRKDVALKVERFRQQSQVYLNRLPILKRQLNETNRLQQFDLYVQKLSEWNIRGILAACETERCNGTSEWFLSSQILRV